MPSLNLRLTEELHATLVAAAKQSGRSLQQEIVIRLAGAPQPIAVSPVRAPLTIPPEPPPATAERAFKPDFKPAPKPKTPRR